MKLVIGLGNPGKQYQNTRHNLGFAAVDAFIANEEYSFGEWHESKKQGALIATGKIGDEQVIAIKSLDFYNNTGTVLSRIMMYYKARPDDVIVLHDDLDLPLGTLKITKSSSGAGNNGVQSIIETLKTQDFRRIRAGINTDEREQMDAQDFVLGKFNANEKKQLKTVIERMVAATIALIKNHPDIEKAQQLFHST